MTSKTNYLKTQFLNHALRNIAYSPPTAVYVGLFIVAPDDTGGGTEVTGGAYVRQLASFTAPSPESCSNDADIVFPMATADWGNIVAFALFDAASAGNMMYHANLTASREVLTSDQLRFPSGQLMVIEQ
jgi:hypothetical protein